MASNRGRRFPPEILRPEEVHRLIRAASNRAPTGIRNRALIVVMYRAGLRVSEALSLHPKDLDRSRGTIRVLQGKGGRARTVGLDPEACAVLERWLDVRAQKDLKGRHRIFCTLHGKPLETAYVRGLLPRLAKRAGIEKRVHPHALRHSHAAELARERLPVNLIQAQLGHSSLATTSRYLAHIAPEELVDAMQKREWTAP